MQGFMGFGEGLDMLSRPWYRSHLRTGGSALGLRGDEEHALSKFAQDAADLRTRPGLA